MILANRRGIGDFMDEVNNKVDIQGEVVENFVYGFNGVDFEELKELNETFLELGCRIKEYSALIPEKLANYMADRLFEQYKVSYSIMASKKAIKDGTGLYVIKARKAALVPWKFFIFRNRICKITDKELKKEFNKLFAEREQNLKDK